MMKLFLREIVWREPAASDLWSRAAKGSDSACQQCQQNAHTKEGEYCGGLVVMCITTIPAQRFSQFIWAAHHAQHLPCIYISSSHAPPSCYYPSVPAEEVKQREWHFWKPFSAVKPKQSRYANTSKPSSWCKHSDKITEAKLGPVLLIPIQCFSRDSTETSFKGCLWKLWTPEHLNLKWGKPKTVETLLNQSKSDSPCPW